jgi:hypothetical protein
LNAAGRNAGGADPSLFWTSLFCMQRQKRTCPCFFENTFFGEITRVKKSSQNGSGFRELRPLKSDLALTNAPDPVWPQVHPHFRRFTAGPRDGLELKARREE